jgi:hypothetical protein
MTTGRRAPTFGKSRSVWGFGLVRAREVTQICSFQVLIRSVAKRSKVIWGGLETRKELSFLPQTHRRRDLEAAIWTLGIFGRLWDLCFVRLTTRTEYDPI